MEVCKITELRNGPDIKDRDAFRTSSSSLRCNEFTGCLGLAAVDEPSMGGVSVSKLLPVIASIFAPRLTLSDISPHFLSIC